VVSGPSIGRMFSVAEGGAETVIGRGKEAQVRIDDAGASRAHARLIQVPEGGYVLEDLGSTNGTFVDGERIDRTELASGHRIHIGPNVVVSFAIVAAQAEHVAQQLYESSVRDPLTRAREALAKQGVDEARLSQIESSVEAEVADARKFAAESPEATLDVLSSTTYSGPFAY